MASLKCHSIADDKDSWENIPQIVATSIKTLNDNFKNVRRWALNHENALKEEARLRLEVDQKVKQTNQKLQAAQEQIKFLFAYANSLWAHQRADCRKITACVQQHLGATRLSFKSLGEAFGVEIDINDTAENELGDLQALVHECSMLDTQLQGLDEAFSSWEKWRSMQAGRIEAVEQATQKLQDDADRTHDRICSWREKIRENSFTVKALHDLLSETQGTVDDLRQSKVSHDQMTEIISEERNEVHALLSKEMNVRASVTDKLDLRCDDLYSKLDSHVEENEQRMDRHNMEVLGIMESNLNPVNAYLNSMHVKADEVKAQLNVIQKKVPVLENGLEEAREKINLQEQEHHNQFLCHDGRLEGLEGCVEKHNEQFLTERTDWTSSIQNAQNKVDGRVDEVDNRMKLSDTLQEDQGNRVVNLEESLSQLQQKVAKWVHTQPLPVKVSEARIFALEARINEEIDRRLQLEARVETPALTTPGVSRPQSRVSQVGAHGLPKLAKNAPPPTQGVYPRRPPSADGAKEGRRPSSQNEREAELLVASMSSKN